MPYPSALIDQHGTTYPCTDPDNLTCQCGDRWTTRPVVGEVMTDQRTGYNYLLLDCEPIVTRGIVRHYTLGLVPLKHSLAVQRFVGHDLIAVVSDVPCNIHSTRSTDKDSPDRTRIITRRELWLPYTPDIIHNDRVTIDGQSYMVIGSEHLPTITRLIVKTDLR